MPPAKSGKTLTPRDIELIKKWIEQGARYEGHWAFLPNRVPATESTDAAATARIDEFVEATRAAQNLTAAPEAERITLLRRLSFDLTGLPPSESEIAAFVADSSPEAFERQVDKLLASPHFGERMAIWWLDLVRYADTVGYHGDQR